MMKSSLPHTAGLPGLPLEYPGWCRVASLQHTRMSLLLIIGSYFVPIRWITSRLELAVNPQSCKPSPYFQTGLRITMYNKRLLAKLSDKDLPYN